MKCKNIISVRLKSKRKRINTVTFYFRDISTLLVGVIFNAIYTRFVTITFELPLQLNARKTFSKLFISPVIKSVNFESLTFSRIVTQST